MPDNHESASPSREELLQKISDLEAQLEDAQETLRAIRSGEVDALVVYSDETERIFTLEGADYTYRVMIESISEGVANLQPDGVVLYCNRRLAEMIDTPLHALPGVSMTRFLDRRDHSLFENLISNGSEKFNRAELTLRGSNGSQIPALFSVSRVEYHDTWTICLVVTDLTAQKRSEEIVAAERLARSILDQAAEAIVVCDPNGIIIRANQPASDLTGQNLLYKPFMKAFPGLAAGENESFFKDLAENGMILGVQASLDPRQGDPGRTVLVSAASLHSENKDLLGFIITMVDITEQVNLRSAIEADRAQLQAVIESEPAGVIVVDTNGTVVLRNSAAEAILGVPIPPGADHTSLPVQLLDAGGDAYDPNSRPLTSSVKSGENFLDVPMTVEWLNGERRHLLVNTAPIHDSSGCILGGVQLMQDITERRRIEEDLNASRERLRISAAATGIGFWKLDLSTGLIDADDQFRSIFRLDPNHPIPYILLMDKIHPEDMQAMQVDFKSLTLNPQDYENEIRLVWENQEVSWIYFREHTDFDPDGRPLQVHGMAMDTTERRGLEEHAREDTARIEVQRRLIEQREQERMQIARDLHDGPLQGMIASTYSLQILSDDTGDSELANRLADIKDMLMDQIRELRSFAYELRPPMLSNQGLENAIRMHANNFTEKHSELKIDFWMNDRPKNPIPERIRLVVFRIFQEALNNIARHAQASQVFIELDYKGDQLKFQISDDGIGFTPPRDWVDLSRQGHLGLVGMRERAEAVGGNIDIQSKAGQGTHLLVTIPFSSQLISGESLLASGKPGY
jgi:PAS domain S-box-containing protein